MPLTQAPAQLGRISEAHARIEVRRDGVIHVFDGVRAAPMISAHDPDSELFQLFSQPELSNMKTLVFSLRPDESQCLA